MNTLDNPVPVSSNQPIWNTVLRYSGYYSAAAILLSLIFYLVDFNLFSFSGMAISFVSYLALGFGVAVMSMAYQRDKLDNGVISYGKALLIGFLVILAGSFVAGIWNYVLVNLIDPNYVPALKEQFANTWGESMPADQLEKTMAEFDKAGDLFQSIKSGVLNGGVMGIIVALISAAFMKREPKMDYMR